MSDHTIRAAMEAAERAPTKAAAVAAFLRALPDADLLSPPFPPHADESIGWQKHSGTLHALAAAVEEAARDSGGPVVTVEFDPVNKPKHYNQHPSGVEAIQVTEHMGFCLGNVMKYVWRADLKNGTEDLEKARWYLDREIARRKKAHDV